MQRFVAARDALRVARQAKIDDWQQGNIEQARDIRARFMANGGE
jgi:hypothetical protein